MINDWGWWWFGGGVRVKGMAGVGKKSIKIYFFLLTLKNSEMRGGVKLLVAPERKKNPRGKGFVV